MDCYEAAEWILAAILLIGTFVFKLLSWPTR